MIAEGPVTHNFRALLPFVCTRHAWLTHWEDVIDCHDHPHARERMLCAVLGEDFCCGNNALTIQRRGSISRLFSTGTPLDL